MKTKDVISQFIIDTLKPDSEDHIDLGSETDCLILLGKNGCKTDMTYLLDDGILEIVTKSVPDLEVISIQRIPFSDPQIFDIIEKSRP